MDSYTSFAEVYDLFMDNVPYKEWCSYLTKTLEDYDIKDGIVLDLGCGTGTLTKMLSDKGYDMIGIDLSYEMLDIAMNEHYSENILYLCQDMRSFELYGTVAAVVSVCDSLNYILEEDELTEVFRLVNNYLDPKGLFIFDMNTIAKYEGMGESVIAENREEGSFIWENYYDPKTQMNEYDLTLYIADEDDRYQRFFETHYQRGYSLDTIRRLLKEAGMEFIAAFDGFSKNPVTKESERMTIIARECGK